jgi:serine/threonine-protein kinase
MIGSRIGHILVTGVLGQGGMGDVYRGTDERLHRPVALKVIRADRRMSSEARGRFLREARTLSSLDHPNICRIHEYIEAEQGDFLILELVEGVTLDRAILQGMSRSRKLRVAIEIADALAAAHRKGIIHRDLKPENVMIMPDGTAKVLDFGIARRDEDEPPAVPGNQEEQPVETADTLIFAVRGIAVTPAGEIAVGRTGAGIAVGTPGSMAPEQARGELATPATDMYAFGLLVQTLFTEANPHPDDLSSAELMMRAARGVTEPMTGQPRDITALVDRLKSLAPADRPTAVETLAVLRRIVDTPRRRMRFATIAVLLVVLAASAAKYVYDVTSARREADRRRTQAEQLVSFIVGDLRTKLEAVGRLDVLDGAASKALAYFASLEPEELSDRDLQQNARALAQLGEVRLNQGSLDAAAKLFGESIRFATTAVKRNPHDGESQLALSNGHFWLGETLRQKGDLPATLQHFQSYLAISRQLAAAHPGDAKYQAEVSYGHGNVGAVQEQAGNLQGALAEYRMAVDLDRERARANPSEEKWKSDLAISLNRLGVALQATGDLSGARRTFEEEMVLRRQLLAAAPNDARNIARLGVSLAYTGVLQQMMGDTEHAVASFREELGLSAGLAERDPANLSVRRNRAVAESRLGLLLGDGRMLQHSVSELRQVVRIDRRPGWRRDLASALQRDAAVSLTAGNGQRAGDESREALAIIEGVATDEPHGALTTRVLCEVLLTAADAEERAAPDAATAHRRRVVALTAGASDHDARITAVRARALIGLGRDDEAGPLIGKLRANGYHDISPAPSIQTTGRTVP